MVYIIYVAIVIACLTMTFITFKGILFFRLIEEEKTGVDASDTELKLKLITLFLSFLIIVLTTYLTFEKDIKNMVSYNQGIENENL